MSFWRSRRYLSPSAILIPEAWQCVNLPLSIFVYSRSRRLVARPLHDMLTSSLYRTLTLQSSNDCKVILEMLLKRKDLCGYIRELVGAPKLLPGVASAGQTHLRSMVANAIKKISRHLKAIRSFDWDGP